MQRQIHVKKMNVITHQYFSYMNKNIKIDAKKLLNLWRENYENIVKVLIEHKVDANTANNNRDTPLFLSSGMDKVINSKSVNINKENKEWEYPLNLAKKGKEIHKDDVMVVEIYKGIIDLLT